MAGGIGDMSLSSFRFTAGNLLGQVAEFLAADDFVVDQAHEEALEGASAPAVDNLANGFSRKVFGLFGSPVEVRTALDGVADVALLLQTLEQRSCGGLLHGVAGGESQTKAFGAEAGLAPHGVHDEKLERAERFAGPGCAKHCSATKCSAVNSESQALFAVSGENPAIDLLAILES